MRTVVFRAPSGCANKIAPQFQPHRPLTSYLLGLRPMNAPPRGIFLIAFPIGAPFFMFGGIGLPPLRGPITGDAIGPRGPLPTGGAIGPRGPLPTGGAIGPIAGGAIGLRPALRSGIGLFGILSCGIGLPPLRGPITGGAIGLRGPLLTGGAIGPRGPLPTGGAIGPIAGGAIGPRGPLGERGLLRSRTRDRGFLIRMVYPIIFCIV
jgi:hypothetical protein